PYEFDGVDTSAASGLLAYDDVPSSATKVYASDDDRFGSDVSGYVNTFGDSTNPVKGHILVFEEEAEENFHIFEITGATVQSGYTELDVNFLAESVTPIASGQPVRLSFVRAVDEGAKGDQGDPGANGADGDDGDDGWSPVFSIQNDGDRRVLRLDDWVGGTGTKPATGDYVGASGLTNDIAQAIDIRGPQGLQGSKGDQGDPGDKGDKGDQGDPGPTFGLPYELSLEGGPLSAGSIQYDDNAGIFYINKTDLQSTTQIGRLIDAGICSSSVPHGYLVISHSSDIYICTVNAVEDLTYYQLVPYPPFDPLIWDLSNPLLVSVYFIPAGNKGDKGDPGAPGGETVALGRWEVTGAATLTADNVFDDSLYSYYTITGQFRPATNGSDLSAVLRSSVPADVGGGIRIGGAFARLDASGSGTSGPLAVLASSINSTPGNGVTWFQLGLHMRNGSSHGIDLAIRYGTSTGPIYAGQYNGEFVDSTPRQGIKFSFSSGNIAAGWIEIVGHLKQAP